jgi:hypothetical protein
MRHVIPATKMYVMAKCNFEICQPVRNSSALECLTAVLATSR